MSVPQDPVVHQAQHAWGAYGFRITGLPDCEAHLHQVPDDWPELRLDLVPGTPPTGGPPGFVAFDANHAAFTALGGDRIEVWREPLTVRLLTAQPLTPDAVLHPYLGLPAAIAARWLGRHSLHGGAFEHAGRAWALLGDREAGKSATLGHLLGRGTRVLSDDVLVIEGTKLFAGPRSVDLRAEAADAIGGGEPLGVIGSRSRWRLRPDRGAAALPLGGMVVLEWGETTRIERLDGDSRLGTVIKSSAFPPGPQDALRLLDLTALPIWRFSRPSAIGDLEGLTDQLLETLSQA